MKASIDQIRVTLEPFATISLARDTDPTGPDMIEGPDLAITPADVRAARQLMDALENPADPVAWDDNGNRRYEPVERRALEIYNTFEYDGPGSKPAWAANGNGLKQDEARHMAREELHAIGHTPAPKPGLQRSWYRRYLDEKAKNKRGVA